jgi:hypothetical protein
LFAGAKIKRFVQILQNIMQAADMSAEFSEFFNTSENKRYLADSVAEKPILTERPWH